MSETSTEVISPMSADEFLEHHGVMGMKWGQHRAKANGSQIRQARRNLQGKNIDYLNQKDKVKALSNQGSPKMAKEQKKLNQMKTDFLKNPDRVTASRLTRGEKAVSILLLSPAGAAAAIATTSAISRRIEYKQQQGSYTKKP